MKLMASGVTHWAAMVRSPSFSRSSSSTTTSIFPWRNSSIASGMGLNGIGLLPAGGPLEPARGQQPLDVLGDDVGLEVDEAARLRLPQVRYLQSIRDEGDREGAVAQ